MLSGALLQAEKAARESVNAARKARTARREALEFAQVGEPDPELVAALERQVAAAEGALAAAEETHKAATGRVDVEHEQLRRHGAPR